MVNAKSNQTTSIIVGIVSLLVGLLLGWYLSGATNKAAAQQQIPVNVTPVPVPVAAQCGTFSRVRVGALPNPITEGRTAMVNDFITDYVLTSNEDETRTAVVQGIKIHLTLSQVDRSGRGSVKSVTVRDQLTGAVLATRQLSNAERRRLEVIIPLTFRTPLILSPGPGQSSRIVKLYADTSTIKNGVTTGEVRFVSQFTGYKSANVWGDVADTGLMTQVTY